MPFDGQEYGRTTDALHKIEGVIDLLATAERWCKNRLESEDGRRCILGAMKVMGVDYTLYRPVLRAITDVTGRKYRRIEHFNDDPRTTHPCVLQVLHRARELVEIGDPAAWAPSWKTMLRTWFGLREPT